MPYLSPALNVMTTAARKAGRGLIRDFGELENLQVSLKGPADFVTAADERTERILIQELSRGGRDTSFSSRRLARSKAGQIAPLHCRPVGRTTNFLHGVPHSRSRSPSSAKASSFPRRLQSVIDEMYTAEKNHGAYLNDKRLRVAARKHLRRRSSHRHAISRPRGHERFLEELAPMMAATAGVRRFGSAALDLAYVAAGRFDAFWERGLAAWDWLPEFSWYARRAARSRSGRWRTRPRDRRHSGRQRHTASQLLKLLGASRRSERAGASDRIRDLSGRRTKGDETPASFLRIGDHAGDCSVVHASYGTRRFERGSG